MNYFYGGAFNPMTLAHLQIICNIEEEMKSDDFLIIGITNHDYKTYEFPYELRKKIVIKNLIKTHNDISHIKVIEQNQRTWKFLTESPKVYWRRPLTIVMGEDEYIDLKKLNIWHYSSEILETFPIKVFSRSEETKDISATKVRELLHENVDFNILNKYITKETFNLIRNFK